MKIPKDYDVVNKEAPSSEKGTLPAENPGIKPNVVQMSPGEKASNDPTQFSINKSQPFKKKGSGY